MPPALIRLRQMSKVYPMGPVQVHALAGVDLDLPEGSMASVLGPSGSGKSTLLHLIGGLDRPTRGTIEVAGHSLEVLDENTLAAFRRQLVGFIFQSFNLIPSMTAAENVGFPMRFTRLPYRVRQERTWEALRSVGLVDRARHHPHELSGGQQQRVAIARALVNDPRLILADEPTGNLDSATGAQIMELLSGLHQAGKTVMVVSHDPRISYYATHSIHLLDGQVVDEAAYHAALAQASLEASSHEPVGNH
jgi:putative ABC transport system ATP-binding protein